MYFEWTCFRVGIFRTFTVHKNVSKHTFGHVRTANVDLRLHIRAFCLESSLGAFLIANDAKFLHITQGNPISGYRRLRDFGGKQMSSSDSVCTDPLLMIKKVLLEDKQRNLYFLS